MAGRSRRFEPHNAIDNKTWSVAIYVRLSDEDRNKRIKTDLSQSIENQISYIKSFVKMLNEGDVETYNLVVYDVYCDDDYTGMNFKRPEFLRMMRDVDKNNVDCIIVKNLSRLGRYDSEMQKYMEDVFEQHGREIRFIAIGDNYDSLYDEMDVLVKFKLLLNREYSENQHKNVIIGMRSMQEKGLFVGAFAPYGYKKSADNKHKLEPDCLAAEVVRRIFGDYLKGFSPKEIARMLTDDGIVNPATYKRMNGSNYKCGQKISEEEKHWKADTIKRILQDEQYTGVLIQHKRSKRKLTDAKPIRVPKEQWVRCENTHEAIVSKENWESVQQMMKTVKRDAVKKDEVTIFKGLLKCGDCKHAMRKRLEKYQSVKDGKISKYLYYNCGTFRDYSAKGEQKSVNMPKCTSHYVSDKVIRNIVLNDINVIISQIKDISSMASGVQKGNKPRGDLVSSEIKAKEAQADTLKNRLKSAKNKWLDNMLDDIEYTETRQEIEKDLHYINKQISILKNSVVNVSTTLNSKWIQQVLSLGKVSELDRETVVALIDKIYVYENKHIEIEYKFSEEFDYLFAKVL
ncbi:MAG: recombinase family protein [Lachnospiraceae bacterium]|nr:recombinase family protein [Lachnospiraceae bacterium]